MTSQHLVRKSKSLSRVLRHHTTQSHRLAMDAAGWTTISAVCDLVRMTRAELFHVAKHNNKRRIQIDGERVRCCQGHSTQDMPVTQAALEASWKVWADTAPVWHGTYVRAVQGIASDGLLPIRRTHVHLAPTRNSVVGKRTSVQFMLAVSPEACAAAGTPIFEAPNGVLLTRAVPVEAIVGVAACSVKAERLLEETARALGAEVIRG